MEQLASGRRRTSQQRKQLPLWQETILLLFVALVLAVVIKHLFVEAFYIPSPSMEPQLQNNDKILVEKPSYWFGTPQRGDIVVFKDPGNWLTPDESGADVGGVKKLLELIGLYPSGGHLVKRVIGVGGDRVVCCDSQGRITVNGHALSETSYLPKGTVPSLSTFNVKVPPGFLWVQGDNRGDSADSRAHMGSPGGGMVSVDLVVGKVFALVWPLNRMQLIHRPATFAGIPVGSGGG